MKAISFSLHTQQPLLATSFQGDPNSDVSYPYIPGTMIRGAIIGRYIKQYGLSELDLDNDEIQSLFFNAKKTKYLNAYLQSNQGKRTLPVLNSWFKDKDVELNDEYPISIYDFSVDKGDEPETPKLVSGYFWTKQGGHVTFYKENRRINIHNRRDRTKGSSSRSTGEGEIFRYDAIDAGQTFHAVILCDDNTQLLKLLQKSEDLWLGGSQSAGYGHIKIQNITPHDNWSEVASADDRIEHEKFTITLLSDLILRDENGQYAVIPPSSQQNKPVPLTKILEDKLGVSLRPQASFSSSTLIGGFNRKWGLPLPQVSAFAAGSVFVFDSISLTLEQIQQLETEGLGERIIDGFGRIAINLQEDERFSGVLPQNTEFKSQPELQQLSSRSLASKMAERLLQDRLEKQLRKHLSYLTIQGDISNSQLSRLQLIARRALPTGDCNLVLSLLNNLPSNARGQFERAQVNNESLMQKLDTWLRQPESWISNPQDLTVKIADIERGFNQELAKIYTLRLIMALAKKATKEVNG